MADCPLKVQGKEGSRGCGGEGDGCNIRDEAASPLRLVCMQTNNTTENDRAVERDEGLYG